VTPALRDAHRRLRQAWSRTTKLRRKVRELQAEALREQAWRVRAWMNLYLTKLAPEYYPDFDQMLMWLPLVGSTFKKVYQDRLLGRPVSRFVLPDNFIVSNDFDRSVTTIL
jgi:hypothetical protein